METTGKTPADVPQISVSQNGLRRGKLRLINRDQIDGRTKAAQRFDAIATGIAEDLGGNSGRLIWQSDPSGQTARMRRPIFPFGA